MIEPLAVFLAIDRVTNHPKPHSLRSASLRQSGTMTAIATIIGTRRAFEYRCAAYHTRAGRLVATWISINSIPPKVNIQYTWVGTSASPVQLSPQTASPSTRETNAACSMTHSFALAQT